MRKASRTLSRIVLGLAVVAALGGLIPSQAATVGHLSVVGRGALPQDGKAIVDVANIAKKDAAGANITSSTLRLTYLLLPSGAPATITSPAFDPQTTSTYKFTIPGPLLEGDYSVTVDQFAGASTTPLTFGSGALSVRVPATLTLTVLNDTVSLPYFGSQRITASLKDANGAAIIGHMITLNISGGLVPQTYDQVAKPTGGDGTVYFDLQEGATLMPGSYEATAKALQSYTLHPTLPNVVTSQTFISGTTSWNVLIPA
jgi:hypothetical protein